MRSTVLEYNDLIDIKNYIKDNVPYFYNMLENGINNYQLIYRGSPSDNKFIKINKTDSKRVSVNTDNYYTEILDNSIYWEDYPNRSNSLICTTSYTKASEYGNVFIIVPINENTEFALAPESDIWLSFNYALNQLKTIFKEESRVVHKHSDFENLAGFNNFLKYKFDLDKADYSDMKKRIKIDNEVIKRLGQSTSWEESSFIFDEEDIKKLDNKYGSFLKYIEYLLSPKWNNFKLVNYNKQIILPNDNELWTDSECLLIDYSIFKKLLLIFE